MATIDVLALIKQGYLSPKQKNHLKQKLRKKRSDLEKAITRVKQALEALGARAPRKKTKRRRGKR
jgi:hypothetical protein